MFNSIRTRFCLLLTTPVLALGLSIVAPTSAQDAEPPATPDDAATKADPNLPDGQSLVEEAITATGGRDAFKKITSMSTIGTMEIPMMGMTLDIEMHSAADGKFLFKQVMPGMGAISTGSDGTVGWTFDPMAQQFQLIEGEQLEQSRRQANVQKIMLRLVENYPTLGTIEQTSFDDEDTYKVRAANEETGEEQFVYFGVEDHLPRAVEVSTPQGPVTLRFKDWKEVGEVKCFQTLAIDQAGMAITMKFTEFKINETDGSVFEQPDEVKQLVEEKDGETPAAEPGG